MTDYQDAREQRRNEKEQRREERRQRWNNYRQAEFGVIHSRHSGVWTGIFILVIGVVALLRSTVPDFPDWLFSWQMLLIALGLFSGLRHNFRGGAWLILILVGSIFLLRDIFPEFSFNLIWPVVLIVFGLFIILRPRNRHTWSGAEKKTDGSTGTIVSDDTDYSKEDFIESTSIFGGAKKIIISKNFKGADLVNIFGGTELDLSQADFTGTAVIELTTIFGGTKLLVPSNWSVKSEAVTIFGGIEDKRRMQTMTEAPDKTLLIRGTVIFGGIDIKSF